MNHPNVLIGGKRSKDVLAERKRYLDAHPPEPEPSKWVEPRNDYVPFNRLAIEIGEFHIEGPGMKSVRRFDSSLERLASRGFERHLLPAEAMAVAIHYLEHPELAFDPKKREYENHPIARLHECMFKQGFPEHVDTVVHVLNEGAPFTFYNHPRGIVTRTDDTPPPTRFLSIDTPR